MPPGYSVAATRQRLTEKLRRERAAELAEASADEQLRIEREISDEIEKEIKKLYPNLHGHIPVMW